MTTPRRRRTRVTARLRAIAGRPADAPTPVTRISTASFERSHRDRVWIAPDPPRRWFEDQGIEEWRPEEAHTPWWKRRNSRG